MTVAPPLLPQEVLQPLELVDVQFLEPDQFFPHDANHLLSRKGPCVPGKTGKKLALVTLGVRNSYNKESFALCVFWHKLRSNVSYSIVTNLNMLKMMPTLWY